MAQQILHRTQVRGFPLRVRSRLLYGVVLLQTLTVLICGANGGVPSAFLPKGVALDFDVDVNENTETLVALRAAVPIPDADDHGGQLLWPIAVEETENTSLLSVETAQLTIRGLYHESASDLTIRLLHAGKAAVLVQERAVDRMYGFPTPRKYWDLTNLKLKRSLRAGTDLIEGIGLDYTFADIVGENIALGRPGEQQSSMDGDNTEAWRATDGDIFVSGMATHTGINPWYQVDLGNVTSIGTVIIWTPDPENRINEVQVVTTKGLVTLGGYFQLALFHNGFRDVTEPIHFDAVPSLAFETSGSTPGSGKGESMQAKLQELDNIGLVRVTRGDADSTGGYAWTITFLTERSNLNQIEIYANNLTAGALRLPEDQVATVIVTTQINGTRNTFYNADMRFGAVLVSSVPFGDANLTEARSLATLERGFEILYTQRQINIPMPSGTSGRYIRITLKQTSYLSIAEVLVYSSQLFSIQAFTGGSPVPAGSYAPENALRHTFSGTSVHGEWILSINDMHAQNVLNEENSKRRVQQSGKGAINDWILFIVARDSSNELVNFTYYVDMSVTIVTLPVYGKLYIAEGDEKGDVIEARPGMKVYTAPCYNDCNHKYTVGNRLSTSKDGSVAQPVALLGDKQVIYVPNDEFLGDDSFKYSLTVSTRESARIGTVNIHVKRCRIDCKNDLFGRTKSVEERLRSPWNPEKTIYFPPDKFGEDGIIYNRLDCEFPPCNVIV